MSGKAIWPNGLTTDNEWHISCSVHRLMGEQHVSNELDKTELSAFMQELLADVSAIEWMLESGKIESGISRIGAEQEFFLVDANQRPAPVASEVLKSLDDPRFTTELARFNLEANLPPLSFSRNALNQMEKELEEMFNRTQTAAQQFGAHALLTGILPTITLSDLTLANLTDVPRYHQLNAMLSRLRKSHFNVHIKGLDEVHITHDNMMLEACNTSFQIHLQVDPEEFVDLYNLGQLITAPVLAAAVNSPLLFGKRLWAETRLALFQHSVDERSTMEQERYRSPRVTFGDRWVEKSVLEIFRQDIARFKVILTREVEENPIEELAHGRTPRLNALRVHNGTVWRWNRPCYGVLNGRPHIRIENRVLPSGPTIPDEVANAAFFFGLMNSVKEEFGPVQHLMDFDQAKSNFVAAARLGLDAQLHWINGNMYPASRLILDHLLPLAQSGLRNKGIDSEDIDRYLGIIRKRVGSGQTGAAWIRKSFSSLGSSGTLDMRVRTLTRKLIELQNSGKPVHEWPTGTLQSGDDFRTNYDTVSQFMSTALFTVSPDDIVDYVASIMHWEHIRHLPVEDDEGRLVGLISQRDLMVLLAQGSSLNRATLVPVSRVMKTNIITVSPETKTLHAIELMKHHQVGCLPVVKNQKLIGIVTTYDLLGIASKLLEKKLRDTKF